MALVGRATITGAYYIALQYGPEVFPTAVRGQGVALSETLGGVAIFLSPLVVYLVGVEGVMIETSQMVSYIISYIILHVIIFFLLVYCSVWLC